MPGKYIYKCPTMHCSQLSILTKTNNVIENLKLLGITIQYNYSVVYIKKRHSVELV